MDDGNEAGCPHCGEKPKAAFGAAAAGAGAIGTLGLGGLMLASAGVGAVAIGALAIGRLSVKRALVRHFTAGTVEIAHLKVGRLDLTDPPT